VVVLRPLQAAGNADTILLGTDNRPNGPDQPDTPVYLTYQTGGFGRRGSTTRPPSA